MLSQSRGLQWVASRERHLRVAVWQFLSSFGISESRRGASLSSSALLPESPAKVGVVAHTQRLLGIFVSPTFVTPTAHAVFVHSREYGWACLQANKSLWSSIQQGKGTPLAHDLSAHFTFAPWAARVGALAHCHGVVQVDSLCVLLADCLASERDEQTAAPSSSKRTRAAVVAALPSDLEPLLEPSAKRAGKGAMGKVEASGNKDAFEALQRAAEGLLHLVDV